MLELNGVILVNKPVGITSYDVIRKLKPLFPRKYKIGHAGTLDPFAEGLLIILVGKGTKLMEKFLKLRKRYTFVMEFGYETDTQDNTGKVTGRDNKEISKRQLEDIINGFIGRYDQIPPSFSAKKVNGVRAYDLARKGVKAELKPKEVEIYELSLLDYDWPNVECRAEVSSGTYIRTLAVDIAHELETLATTTKLVRNSIGSFSLEDSISVDQFDDASLNEKLISVEKANDLLG